MQRLMLAATAAVLVSGISPAGAATIDLVNNTSGTQGGAYFTRTQIQPTGSGAIKPFVRLQDSNGIAEGYNSDGANPPQVMPDVVTGTHTHDIKLSEIGLVVNPQGLIGSYYEFLLDINQQSSSPLLSLDKVDIYTRSTPLNPAAGETNELSDLTTAPSVLRFSLDEIENSVVLLNYNFNSGSGSGDMLMYIPQSAFVGALGTDNLYLYSSFGGTAGYEENDGFEEWAVRSGTAVPDGGATLMLLGLTMFGMAALRRSVLVN